MLGRAAETSDQEVSKLSSEVASRGWIVFADKTDQGDYELFACRPDGSARQNLTRTTQFSEFGGRFSHDGKRLLYRRIAKGESIDRDLWGAAGSLVIANADGSNPVETGGIDNLPWASWSPDDRQLACLYKREGRIRIIDAATLELVRELPRGGIYQQLFWSSDGKMVCGTANLNGQDWNIMSVDLASGRRIQVSRGLCSAPDWFQADPGSVIYSCKTQGLTTERECTMLMEGTADGRYRTLIYGERGRHASCGCTSPDDKYVVFSLTESDGGVGGPMVLIRLADAPIVVPTDYSELKPPYTNTKTGPVLRLPHSGFEPHWTYAEPFGSQIKTP